MRRAILLLLICLALCAPVRAEGAADELYDALDIGQAEAAVPQEARDILGDAGVEDAMEPEGMLSRLADAALEKLGSLWRSAAASGLKPGRAASGALVRGTAAVGLLLAALLCIPYVPIA